MNFRLLLVLPLLIYSCKSEIENHNKRNDLEQHNLYGKVKSVKEYRTDNNWEFHRIYNPSGNLTTTFQHDKDFTSKINFEFNEVGLKTAENISTLSHGNHSNHKFTYEYDDKGNLIFEKVYRYNPNLEIEHTTEHIYDIAGEETEKIVYNNKGAKDFILKFKYDDIGNLIENKWYNAEGLNSITKSQYDKKGNITIHKVIYPDIHKGTSTTYEYIYDEFNNIINEKVSCEGKLMHCKYLYKYDNQDNWIKKIEIRNNESEKITERLIEYY